MKGNQVDVATQMDPGYPLNITQTSEAPLEISEVS